MIISPSKLATNVSEMSELLKVDDEIEYSYVDPITQIEMHRIFKAKFLFRRVGMDPGYFIGITYDLDGHESEDCILSFSSEARQWQIEFGD